MAAISSSGAAEPSQEVYPHLFSEMRIGAQRVRNRIALASMFTGRARNGDVTPELIAFYANRAAGGAGLIVTEAVSALRHAPAFAAQVSLYRRQEISGLQRGASAVRRCDSLIIAQLQDSGRGDMLSWTMPHALTVDEIAVIRDDFIAAAALLQKAGFSGVEISAGHGHLFHQFLSPWMNRREDEYGGDRPNRLRALTELLDGIRDACGAGFVVGARLPGNDGLPGSIDANEAGEIAQALTSEHRLDYVNFVQGAHAWSLYMHVPDLHAPRATYAQETARLRDRCGGTPVAVTGRIVDPAQAEALLARGEADFVMMGRTLLADAAWGLKARQGRDGDIRKCVSCNSCWAEAVQGKPLACDNNPRAGRPDEVDWWPTRTRPTRRVTVVGGGLAGLETAWVAAARGHEVTLFSASEDLGGKARLYASLPGCEAASATFDYQIAAARRAGVDFRLQSTATLEAISAEDPDAVVVASGGRMLWPAQLPAAWRETGMIPDLWTLIADLGRMREDPGAAVIYDFDGTDVVYSAAEALSHRFARVVLINPVECLARDEPIVKRQAIYRRLAQRGVDAVHWSELSAEADLEEGRLAVRHILTGETSVIEGVSLLAYATPRAPDDRLAREVLAAGFETHVIGDAFIPRTALATVREAHDLGESL